MDKLNKLSLPATIIIASLTLGGFYYASQVNKQRSIERQQQIKIEQENKEYIAKRKLECYEMYLSEKKRVSNAENYDYIENYNFDGTPDYRDDTCEIMYENSKYNEAICEQKLKEYKEYEVSNMRALITECKKYFSEYR